MIEKSEENENEIVRLTIQIGIVTSCLVVITNDYSVLVPWFQILLKVLALFLATLSMIYIMLTGQKFGFSKNKESKLREKFYGLTISFFWIILFMMALLFSSDFISHLFGISFTQIVTMAVFIVATAFSIKVAIRYS